MQRKFTVLGSGLLILVFLVWLLATSGVSGVLVALPQYGNIRMDKSIVFVILGAAELLLILPLFGYMAITKTSVRALLGNRTKPMQYILAAALGVLLAPALQGLDSVVSELLQLLGAKIPDTSIMEPDSVVSLMVGVVTIGVCAGIVEEPIFRGVVQRGIGSALGKRAAIVLTALVFALIHLEGVGFLTRFLIGLVLGGMAWRSGAILPGVITHAAYNSAAIGIPFLLGVVLPNWNGFTIIPGAAADVNAMLTWVLLSIPFAVAAFGAYYLFKAVTPASAAFADAPYDRKSVKFVHTLPWIAIGLGGVLLTAGMTLFELYAYKIIDMLNQFSNYYR